jgi:hypothetical protein
MLTSLVVGLAGPHHGQMASPLSRYFIASCLNKDEWSSVEFRADMTRVEMEVVVEVEVMGGGWVDPMCLLWVLVVCISTRYLVYICNSKIFYDTMKYRKMNDGI